jgi:hypothetical protein
MRATVGASIEEQRVPAILDFLGTGYNLRSLDVAGAPPRTIDFVSADGSVHVEVTTITNQKDEASNGARRKRPIKSIPGEWRFHVRSDLQYRSLEGTVGPLLDALLQLGHDRFDSQTSVRPAMKLKELGLLNGERLSTQGAGCITYTQAESSGFSISELTQAIDEAVSNNLEKLTDHPTTELFIFVKAASGSPYWAFRSLETYVAGYSPPGPLKLPPNVRCVWLCELNGESFTVWRADGQGDGNWCKTEGHLPVNRGSG